MAGEGEEADEDDVGGGCIHFARLNMSLDTSHVFLKKAVAEQCRSAGEGIG